MRNFLLLALPIFVVASLSSCAANKHLSMKNVVGLWTLKSITTEFQSNSMTTSEADHPDFFKEYRLDGTYENRVGDRVTNSGHFELKDNHIQEHVATHDNPYTNLAGKTVELEVKLLNKDELKYSYNLPNGAYVTELWTKKH